MPDGRIEKNDIISDEALSVFDKFKKDVDSVANSLKGLGKEQDKLRKQSEKNEASQKELIELMQREARTIDEARKQNIQLRKERGLIDATTKKGRQEIKKLNDQIDKNNNLIKQNVDGLTKQKIGIGKYSQAVQGAILKLSLFAAGLKTAIRFIGNSIQISSNFEKQMDKVRAVTDSTDSELESLSKQAKELGSTTTRTATQVGELQEELAKLGFITREILSATDGILALSEATGADLAQAATVSGATIRGFGLDASETNRVVDVMAKSFASSALDINKFEIAMAQVAPVAKSSGIEIEEATAMLSALVDAGLDASTAGTSLRNILLENAKEGRSLSESMDILNSATDKNSAAMDLFGKRGAVAAIVLSDNVEKTKLLTKAYDDAEGAAKDMADVMRDNLKGDVEGVKSAWEGLVLSIEDGSGGITSSIRGILQFTSKLLTDFRLMNESFKDKGIRLTFEEASENVKKFQENLKDGLSDAQLIDAYNFKIAELNKTLQEQRKIQEDNYEVTTNWVTGLSQVVAKDKELEGQLAKITFRLENEIKIINQLIDTQKNASDQDSKTTENTLENLRKQKEEYLKQEMLKNKLLLNEQANIKRHNDEISKLQQDFIKKQIEEAEGLDEKKLQDALNYTEYILENQEIQDEALIELRTILNQQLEKLDLERINRETEEANAELEREKQKNNAKLEYRKRLEEETQNLIYSSFDLYASLLERQEIKTQQNLDKRIAYLNNHYNKILEDETLTSEQREDIEKERINAINRAEQESAIKIAKIKRKQALLDRAAALFNIAIDTARGVMSVLSTGGGTRYADFGVSASILSALVIATGAVQAAAVLAKPLPEIPSFFKGVKDFEGGKAEIHGGEIIKTPNETFLTDWGKYEGKLMDLPKHTEVIPNDLVQRDLANLMKGNNIINVSGGITKEEFEKISTSNNNKLVKAINQSNNLVTFDENNFNVFIRKHNNLTVKRTRKYRNA